MTPITHVVREHEIAAITQSDRIGINIAAFTIQHFTANFSHVPRLSKSAFAQACAFSSPVVILNLMKAEP